MRRTEAPGGERTRVDAAGRRATTEQVTTTRSTKPAGNGARVGTRSVSVARPSGTLVSRPCIWQQD
jgi:hypothetical protein